jgi:L-asparaginase
MTSGDEDSQALPRISLIALGGTIAMGAAGDGGVRHSLDAAELAANVLGAGAGAEIEAVSLRRLPGWQLGVADVVELARVIETAFDDGARGVVVTQGTDTIEETSFLLELLGVAERGAVVVTGAMRNPTLPGADGPANLLGAVATAAAPQARGVGVLVVMGDEIHAARLVAKAHATSPSAFVSYPGALGWLSEGRPVLVTRPVAKLGVPGAAAALGDCSSLPAVPLVRTWLGDDGALVGHLAELGCDGLVVEGSGGGHVTAQAAAALAELAKQVPVVIASRTGAGAVLRSTYAAEGGEIDLARRGVIGAGWLPGLKARLLLLVLVATGADREALERAFAAFA